MERNSTSSAACKLIGRWPRGETEQVYVELASRKAFGQPVGRVHCQGGLTTPGHSIHLDDPRPLGGRAVHHGPEPLPLVRAADKIWQVVEQ